MQFEEGYRHDWSKLYFRGIYIFLKNYPKLVLQDMDLQHNNFHSKLTLKDIHKPMCFDSRAYLHNILGLQHKIIHSIELPIGNCKFYFSNPKLFHWYSAHILNHPNEKN